MKLKATFLFLFFLITLSSSAKKRSSAEILNIAEQYLGTTNTRAGSTNLAIIAEKEMLTIVGGEGLGFVVVSNDDSVTDIVGYSKESFSVIPPAMEWFINTVDNNMQEMTKSGVLYAPIPPSTEFPESVEPLLKSTWDQGKPYNILCPGGNGSSTRLYPTGCVATALSQIMYYHKYPEVGIGEHQYSFKPESGVGRIISANFGETHYDWANMLDDYSKGYTDEQANAVATLMLHCGVAVEMGYTASGSGAYGQEACLGIKKFFGYNKNARLYTRDYYTAELWMEMIFKELNLKRPIYYDGMSEGGGGHAFIIDGYDKDGFVHVNWGWGGNSNGFFDIALLNPPGSSYSKAQGMILGMCKPDVDIPYESQVVATELGFIFSGTNTKRVTISGVIHNAGAEKFVGTIACVLENSENTIVLKKQEDLTLQAITGGMWYNTNFSLLSNNLSSIPDGTYRLFVGSKTAEDIRWQLVRPKEGEISSYTVVKNGTDVTWTESRDDRWTSTTTGISSVTIKPHDKENPYIFDLQGRNQGNDINSLNKGIYIIGGKKVVR
jgi:hypothetical protein